MARWLKKEIPKIDFNPGEFEVLATKASREWWQKGSLVMTNHRLFWFAYNPQKDKVSPVIEVDMQKVLGCVEVRSWYYLLLKPALRILIASGKSVVFHDIKDLGGVKRNVERFMGQERYTLGSLFSKQH